MEKNENINEVIEKLQQTVKSLTDMYTNSLYRIEKLETKVISLQQRTYSSYDCD
jgi:hypothetical protein